MLFALPRLAGVGSSMWLTLLCRLCETLGPADASRNPDWVPSAAELPPVVCADAGGETGGAGPLVEADSATLPVMGSAVGPSRPPTIILCPSWVDSSRVLVKVIELRSVGVAEES